MNWLNVKNWALALLGAFLAVALVWGFAQRADVAKARQEAADYRAAQADLGREFQKAIRAREAELASQYEKGARDGQARIDAARADADRAGAAEQRVRDEFRAFRLASSRLPKAPSAAGASQATPDAIGMLADVLGELGERTERISRLAGIYARTADLAYATGLTCQQVGAAP